MNQKTINTKTFLDTSNHENLVSMMDICEHHSVMYFLDDEEGKAITLEICHDYIVVEKMVSLGLRRNFYYRNGTRVIKYI